jgi:archaellum component FlaF (FlaF/FlaG flagellin family)
MGSSTVITHVILFIAVLSIASGLLIAIKNYADEAEGTFNEKSNEYQNQIKTNLDIDVVDYNNVTNTTTIYVRNTGRTILKPSTMDVYIDGIRIPRNASNRTIGVTSDTDSVNSGNWDPKEILQICVFMYLNSSITHEVIVSTPYAVRETETFSI